MLRTNQTKEKLCRTCGVDITSHAKYMRWTQCSYCYWKDRLEKLPRISNLLEQRAAIEARHSSVNQRLKETEAEAVQYQNNLKSTSLFWRILFAIGMQDKTLRELQKSSTLLRCDAYSLQRQLESNQSSIELAKKSAKHIRKRFTESSKYREAWQRRNIEETTKRRIFQESCLEEYESDYQRDYFRFRKKDYKRGNALDNYFRNRIFEKVVEVFNNACVFCESKNNLTLDHYAIPKNEGGNFVLWVEKNGSLKLNLIVLCRSCNAAKGERPYLDFFNAQNLEVFKEYHRKLLELILNDSDCLKVIKKWYG